MEKSEFQRWYEASISNLGNFYTRLYELFILASSGNRKKLIEAFPDRFNKGDEDLEWNVRK